MPSTLSIPGRHKLAAVFTLSLAAASPTLLTAVPAQAATTATITEDFLTYEFRTDSPALSATVTRCEEGVSSDLEIPDTITVLDDTYTVVAIGDYACNSSDLTSVTLPPNLTTIGRFAFEQNDLTSVTLPPKTTTVGDCAFQWNQLTSVVFPDSVTTIGGCAFNLNRLTSVDLPDSVTTIGNGAFSQNRLTSVSIPPNVTNIQSSAFQRNKIASVNLPDNLTTIGPLAFYDNQLTSVTLPPSVTEIGQQAFILNPELTRVYFTGPAPKNTGGFGPGGRAAFANVNGLVVSFLPQYRGATELEGFTTPRWRGYATATQGDYLVTYDTRGGEFYGYPDVVATDGEVVEPSDAIRPGYTFTGWYTTPSLDNLFDFAERITTNIILYAGWQAADIPGPEIPGPEIPGPDTPAAGPMGSLSS